MRTWACSAFTMLVRRSTASGLQCCFRTPASAFRYACACLAHKLGITSTKTASRHGMLPPVTYFAECNAGHSHEDRCHPRA